MLAMLGPEKAGALRVAPRGAPEQGRPGVVQTREHYGPIGSADDFGAPLK